MVGGTSELIWYVYPIWHRVSFTLISEKHIEQLKKYFRLYTIDEKAIPNIYPVTRPLIILHPFFYNMSRIGDRIEHFLSKVKGIIGVDVADSNSISNLAVSMTHYAEAMIVPSEWSKRSYINSGCKTPVYVVPHGLDKTWYETSSNLQFFDNIAKYKKDKKKKLLLYFCWHSEYRKGLDLVLKVYETLIRERKDVSLVAKFMTQNGYPHMVIRRLGGIIVSGWLTEEQKMELYDLSDIYLLFSRGGAFEHNGLEAIARNCLVVAARGGAWQEYLPDFSLVDSRPTKWVLKDNPIHNGGGVEVIVDKAIDRIHIMLDNLDDYKQKLKDYVEEKIKNIYTWENAGKKLAQIIRRYL